MLYNPPSVEHLNYILTELNNKRSGTVILGLLQNKYPQIDNNQSFLIQQKLEKDGFIQLKQISSDRKSAQITERGREHILTGGYAQSKPKVVLKRDVFDPPLDVRKIAEKIFRNTHIPKLSDLHKKVQEVSAEQFKDGHYREAVLNAFVALTEVIKAKYPISDHKGTLKDGVDLMQDVFSSQNCKHQISSDANEQKGIMFLYAGAIAAIRNKYGHKTAKIKEAQQAVELLHFASFLFRLLDDPAIY